MYFVSLASLDSSHLYDIRDFILRYEYYSVQLSSTYKTSIESIYGVYLNDSLNDLVGLVSIKKTILHLIPYLEKDLEKDFIFSFILFYSEHGFSLPLCINGLKRISDLFIMAFKELGLELMQLNSYTLMIGTEDTYKLKSQESLKNSFIRCISSSPKKILNDLYLLHKEYELEEVLPDFKEFDEKGFIIRLNNALAYHCIICLNIDGKLVSKAQSNSIGMKYVQIGGVFTLKDYRGLHYSYNTMIELIRVIRSVNKYPVLFVRKENESANRLYQALHFRPIADYEIAYY